MSGAGPAGANNSLRATVESSPIPRKSSGGSRNPGLSGPLSASLTANHNNSINNINTNSNNNANVVAKGNAGILGNAGKGNAGKANTTFEFLDFTVGMTMLILWNNIK